MSILTFEEKFNHKQWSFILKQAKYRFLEAGLNMLICFQAANSKGQSAFTNRLPRKRVTSKTWSVSVRQNQQVQEKSTYQSRISPHDICKILLTSLA